ncbi:hypothetical protein CIB95_13380 [Lottiidibacillus patelloidae]|uniref:DUF3891 domain-containing protein n=1 Tax=Lottiidibacillus patelloidae TaxID=2670334 RepID=A0A263BQW6_9BACI|nr:DUF3891 family protein [Lottiidibacillus patelloidae]OZM56095.1 hypothetical protein CIB95_13380 [Lottiidibacillus patelloidae]
MIIFEENDHFILYTQHDHGLLSGEIAFQWGNSEFPLATFNQIMTATYHDFAWYDEDLQPKWDYKSNKPYDFVEYPTSEKLIIYKNGISQLEKLYPHCALLTSLHYCSFYNGRNDKEILRFLSNEKKRQQKLKNWLKLRTNSEKDLSFLKLCDDFSLYVCLNEPGVSKSNEHPWYKNGISYKNGDEETIFELFWSSKEEITITPFPFKEEWETSIPYRKMCKETKKIVGKGNTRIKFRKHEQRGDEN